MTIQLHFKTIPATEEMVAEVLQLSAGGEELFEFASLRPQDEIWWTKTTKEIARSLQESLTARSRGQETWVFTLGLLLRDCERLEMEALCMGDEAIRARRQLRAFAIAIAIALGCASWKPEPEDDES
jgi:hypothetical protein